MPATQSHTITVKPTGKATTLDELAAFVQEAQRAGADGGEIPKVRIRVGGGIKSISVEITRGTADRTTADA
jgi:translation elongation factor EF-1beta